MTEDDPLEMQQALVEASLAAVFTAYDDAAQRGEQDPLVVLLDCEDELGGEIARGWLGDEAVDDAIASQHAEDEEQMTVFARALPWKESHGELSEAFPYLADALSAPPAADAVLVVVVAAGGASAFTAPADARPE